MGDLFDTPSVFALMGLLHPLYESSNGTMIDLIDNPTKEFRSILQNIIPPEYRTPVIIAGGAEIFTTLVHAAIQKEAAGKNFGV